MLQPGTNSTASLSNPFRTSPFLVRVGAIAGSRSIGTLTRARGVGTGLTPERESSLVPYRTQYTSARRVALAIRIARRVSEPLSIPFCSRARSRYRGKARESGLKRAEKNKTDTRDTALGAITLIAVISIATDSSATRAILSI